MSTTLSKNQHGDITGAKDEEDVLIIQNEHGMYVGNLEYDSDETRETTEEELFEYEREYERVVHTVEENDEGGKTVVKTVEGDDEDDEVF
jgi:RNA recognition motif-containing protein